MRRRDVLRGLLATASAGLVPAGLLRAAECDPLHEAFHAALAGHDWLLGWQGFDGEALAERTLRWEGRPPAGLSGTLYRNGPARFERAGQRYRHWFDGDGLVQAWRLRDGALTHRARMVATPKFVAEQAAGRFLRTTAGTVIDDAEAVHGNDDLNVANTSVLHHAGRMYALWEGGSAWELDAETLHARGPRQWGNAEFAGLPFSAHPLRDVDGSLWNVGLAAYAPTPTLLVWRIDAAGEHATVAPITLEKRGYLHSFVQTRRHLVFVLAPWLYRPEADGAFFERMHWTPEAGCEVIVVAKDALDRPRRYHLSAGLAFHHTDAHEEADCIALHACWHADGAALIDSLSAPMRGEARPLPASGPLARIELPLDAGEARLSQAGPDRTEFPVWDTRHHDSGGRCWFTARSDLRAPYLDSVLAWDARRDRVERFVYGSDWLVEEHLFVPRTPDAPRDRGWLVGTALHLPSRRLCLSVFDAARIADGPRCRAFLPQWLPLGFHGSFVMA